MLLPRINPVVRVFKGADKSDGSPTWTLHHPAANKYYQVGWMEFECISRFHVFNNAEQLIQSVNTETSLNIDLDDLKDLLIYLNKNGLLEHDPALVEQPSFAKQPFLQKILHNYLFFSIPLIKPDWFLKATSPFVKPVMSKVFLYMTMICFFILLFLTIQRFDEFMNTFINLMSVKGAALLFITLICIKICHEFGHAFTAHRYGVDVPHMGVAFMVMYPVFYTETSASWQLSDNKSRIYIGLSGVITELILATYALAIWHIMPPGILNSLAFAVVSIALVGSLLVNLNPFMRFDGYFVLSDTVGIENLHAQSFAFAKWWIRKTLFGLNDDVPEDYKPDIQRLLIFFGVGTIIHRFFLFLGIALLVYWLFFKPLGFILMVVELLWFIGFPVFREITVWWERRADILSHSRIYILGAVMVLSIGYVFLPFQQSLTIPAIAHAKEFRRIYPPVHSTVEKINVAEGQAVNAGDILVVLSSDELEYDIRRTTQELQNLQTEKRILFVGRSHISRSIDEEITATEIRLRNLLDKSESLTIRAPFNGTIRSLNPDIHNKMAVSQSTALFDLVDERDYTFTAYIDENALERVAVHNHASFRPQYQFMADVPLTLTKIGQANERYINWPELSSIYHGPIPSEFDVSPSSNVQEIKARQTIYAVMFDPVDDAEKNVPHYRFITAGTINVEAKRSSTFWNFVKKTLAFVKRESGFN